MNTPSIRLSQQKITQQDLTTPQEIVSYMGAIQAQDFPMSRWAVGLRLPNSKDKMIENALNDGLLVRTHVLRPTWHIVSGQDVRWMLALTAKNIKASSVSRDRDLGIDSALYAKTNDLIVKALEGGKNLTRQEIMDEIEKGGVKTDSSRAVHFMMNAEVDAIVCNGIPNGKEQTYALLDEKVGKGTVFSKEEALSTLAKRFFTSHAPATIQDFHWWSGLSMPEARLGLESIKNELKEVIIEEKNYFLPKDLDFHSIEGSVFLLPAFDEYCVSYKDRSLVFDTKWHGQAITSNGIFKPIIVINGKVEGIWKREIKKNKVVVEPTFFDAKHNFDLEKIQSEAKRFGKFLDLEAEVKVG